jgi:succinate dehydrogenase/fumarate reductase flavoprotein subunit
MPEEEKDKEAKLRKLAARLRLGYQKLHPVKESELNLVREVVRQEWDKKLELARQAAKAEQTSKSAALEKTSRHEHVRKKHSGRDQNQERSDNSQEPERERGR